jgi:translation initiation factor IF-3
MLNCAQSAEGPSVGFGTHITGRTANINKQLRVNERIRVREVRLVDEDGHQAGIVLTRDALDRAKGVGLDLIEVSPTAVPPVCRIMDYGKFKYEQSKREREGQKKSKQVELSAIRIRPNIDDHDLIVKLRNARRFLEEGDKVRVYVMFRSRELSHPERGRRLLERFVEEFLELANVEKTIGMEGRQMSLVLAAKPKAVEKPVKAPKAPSAAAPKTAVAAALEKAAVPDKIAAPEAAVPDVATPEAIVATDA